MAGDRYRPDELAGADIEAWLAQDGTKSLLRFITCGSVDDGKSTLIGRLLYDSRFVFDDHMAALETDSRTHGTQGGDLDFALLVDGLAAEREQGITIDVAYRFFSTAKRKFIVADTPGHEQYTRNMVTGASAADLAVVLVDARKGVLTQTRRHTFLAALLGIRHVALAVNKMDLVGWSQEVFASISAEYLAFARAVGIEDVTCIPISGLTGDNIALPSGNLPWYDGPALLAHLETVELADTGHRLRPLRMPVQWVNRPNLDFRGFAGQIVSGRAQPGDAVRILPSGRTTTIDRIVTFDGDLDAAVEGQSVTLTLADPVDVSRGDMIVAGDEAPEVADQFEASIVWMAQDQLMPGRSYWLKLATRTTSAQVTEIKHRIDVNNLQQLPAKSLSLNDVAVCNISVDQPLPFEPYGANRHLGGFILMDRQTNATVGGGMIRFALRRSHNIHWQALDVSPSARAAAKGQKPTILWFTGLSGAGKSTIANLVERRLHAEGRHTYILDGDNVRHGLNRDLGFTEPDRVENIRRVAEVARLMAEAGLIVLVSFISPFRAERRMAREMVAEDQFIEIFVDASMEALEKRDPKGLYAKARRGDLKNFTGIDSPYEEPERPDIHIDTAALSAEEGCDLIVAILRESGRLDAVKC